MDLHSISTSDFSDTESACSEHSIEFRDAETGERPRLLSSGSDLEVSFEEEKKAPLPFRGGRTISLVSKSSSSISGETSRERFFSRDIDSSSDDSNDYLCAEQPSKKSREEIIQQGHLLSAADFKKVANQAKVYHSPTYRILIKSIQDYDRTKEKLSPKERLQKLSVLEEKAETYRQKKIGEQEIAASKTKPISGSIKTRLENWSSKKIERKQEKNQGYINATDLLMEGIAREKEELRSEPRIFSINEENEIDEPANHYQEPLAKELRKTLEKFSPLANTNIAARIDAREGLISALVQSEDLTILPKDLPKLIDQQDAMVLKNLTREKFEEILTKCDLDETQRNNAQTRLVLLKNHIATVQRITTMNEAKKAEGISLDVGTSAGFQSYFQNATRQELEALGSYRPAPHLVGAAIVTNWNS